MAIKAGGYISASEWADVDWTPTLTSATLGAGATQYGYYRVTNGLLLGHFMIVFGTSPSFSSTIRLDLPSSYLIDGQSLQQAGGYWNFRDNSATEHYAGVLGLWSASTNDGFSFGGAWDGTAPRSRITNGVPFTVGSGDILSGNIQYRVA